MTLTIRNATLFDRPGAWDLAIADGRITHIDRSSIDLSHSSKADSTAAGETLNASGYTLLPGLVDPHIHLDKALILDRYPPKTGTFDEALQQTLLAKQSFTVDDLQARATKVLETAISYGIVAMRSHVEVDTIAGLRGMEALLPLKERYDWGITLQLAVFAQDGITNQPGIQNLLREAMRQGGDVIGSAPYVDPDPESNIRTVFDIAAEFDAPVDFHLDFLDNDSPMLLPFVIQETHQRGWQGRVCLGHMTKLASLPFHQLAAVASDIADAGISILGLPASDLYMMARKDDGNVRRGVAPLHRLAQQGVVAGIATNNIQNLFTPFGDGDVLKLCTLLAQVLQLGTAEAHQLCLELATTRAAAAIDLPDRHLQPGAIADLVLVRGGSSSEIVATASPDRIALKQGQVVSRACRHVTLSPSPDSMGR